MSQITSHVLDTSMGKPGQGILIELQAIENDTWKTIGSGKTDSDGRIQDLLPAGKILEKGTYQLIFHTGNYYREKNITSFYPKVSIHFHVFDESHYHVPLLLNPFGYSTYRGT